MPGLQKVAAALVAPGKGILAADESIATMLRRLEAVGAAPTAQMRRGYRRLLLITQGLAAWISGIILCDETLRQDLPDGTPSGQGVPAFGIMAVIKVDKGTTPLPFADGGVVTQGLDGYRELGVVFAKWRTLLNPASPHGRTVHALARYAALCHEMEIVPVVEPEVLMDGGQRRRRRVLRFARSRFPVREAG